MKKTICLLMLFILMCSLFSCKSKDKMYETQGEISVFMFAPDTLNPVTTKYKTNASLLTSMLYKPLIVVNEDLTTAPCLATNWKFSKDGKILKLFLREDVLFSDGTPLKASHAKAIIETLKEHPQNLYSPVTEYVDSCTASDNVLTIKLKKRGTGILSALNFPIYKDKTSLLGCGSYVLSEKTDTGLVFSANTNQYATADYVPKLSKINVLYYPSKEAAANAFLATDIDVVSCDINSLSTLSTMTDISQIGYITDKFTYLGFNCKSDILKNAYARKAIAHLIDKQSLVDSMIAGYAQTTNSPFRPGSSYDQIYKYDLKPDSEKAKQNFEKSGTPEVPSFSILINEESSSKAKTAEFINNKLRENGIDSTVVSLPYEQYLEKIENGEYTTYIGEVIIPADQDLTFLLHSSYNNLNYNVKEMDNLLTEFSSSYSQTEKNEHAKLIQQLLLKHVPIISLYYEKEVFSSVNKINGPFSPYAHNLYNNIKEWHIQ